ncbi:glycoprotein-N-acetylgalactosamine 3-beta-galactosyltransferase 1-B-like [Gigantopelta aegis]|uniref:glycoprotein-N-acetylgalactosamine 3-beta-galactosyltransferase 1-B-like n=1 Tax=Gigantopelta aegis TaxID=1735272 RepID=UPI001B88BF22|nr:glycoprotein-N-acetylgalactosamine 3-beta-galactosyltransferase 1-B-like [Gigantopelta aegis]
MMKILRLVILLSVTVLVVIIFVSTNSLSSRRQMLGDINSENLLQIIKLRESKTEFTAVASTMPADHVARKLFERVRVLCWVMTSPQNLEPRVKHVLRTWGRRCNKLVIISSKANATYGAVAINVTEGRNQLTQKTLGGFHYVYKHHFDDADWFLKTDDDTYVIMENLRYMLSEQDPKEPVYFGHHFNSIGTFPYSSGGSGFVVSKEALRRFGREADSSKVCRQTGSAGDEAFGQCMGKLGVKLKNSTDKFGGTRFHCLNPSDFVTGRYPDWLYRYDANGLRKGVDSISDYVISFHYVAGNQMDVLEYLIYHAKPYGIKHVFQDLNQH